VVEGGTDEASRSLVANRSAEVDPWAEVGEDEQQCRLHFRARAHTRGAWFCILVSIDIRPFRLESYYPSYQPKRGILCR
jgi:hypothetical protein